jgi:transcriptional regulator with XRE-family HTH domain
MKAPVLKRRRRVVSEDGPDPIDVYVGMRVRESREKVGLSQAALAKQIGVSFQTVQKYETAENRISASTLFRLGQVLDVPPGYFFEGCVETGLSEAVKRSKRGRR